MTRPVALARLKPLYDHFDADDADWPVRVQGVADQVYALLTQPDQLTDGQFSALVSLADSVTVAGITGSAIIRLLNAGNVVMAYYEFPKWVFGPDPVTGQPVVLPSLTARRTAEQALFIS